MKDRQLDKEFPRNPQKILAFSWSKLSTTWWNKHIYINLHTFWLSKPLKLYRRISFTEDVQIQHYNVMIWVFSLSIPSPLHAFYWVFRLLVWKYICYTIWFKHEILCTWYIWWVKPWFFLSWSLLKV